MKLLDLPLLADENVDREVIATLRERGKDVRSVIEEGLGGHDDVEILRRAFETGRVVLTHDSDFGTLAIRRGEPFVGILFLRPGNIRPEITLEMLAAVESLEAAIELPAIVVAERRGEVVRIRLRSVAASWVS